MHKVLIVEDDQAIQFMYKTKLENAGFAVQTVGDGKAGLALAESFLPGVILLDLRMPIMTGDVMLQKLRSTTWGSDMRIIVLTNISRDEAPSALRFLNVDRYVVKAHSTPAQVVEIVQELVGRNAKK